MYVEHALMKLDRSRWMAVTGMMSALALAGNYALAPIPNVELSTTIFFLTAYTFGSTMAASCVLIVAVVYGTVNPWGGAVPLILFAQIVGWLFTVVVGTLMRVGNSHGSSTGSRWPAMALAGLVTTSVFDITTNMAYAWTFDIPFLTAVLFGLHFMLIHVISNALLFALVIERLDRSIRLHIIPMAA
jgi:hypothetical protein